MRLHPAEIAQAGDSRKPRGNRTRHVRSGAVGVDHPAIGDPVAV